MAHSELEPANTETSLIEHIDQLWQLLEQNRIAFDKPDWLAKKVDSLRFEKVLGGRNPDPKKIQLDLFMNYFHGRPDRFLRRAVSGRFYLPCAWRNTLQCKPTSPTASQANPMCVDCKNQKPEPLNRQVVLEHLTYSPRSKNRAIKIYPIQPDNATWFLAFDLDSSAENPDQESIRKTLDALERTIHSYGFQALKVINAKKTGGQLWLFFEQPVPCGQAVEFGQQLILRAILEEGLHTLDLFEAMVPNRQARSMQDPGNPIELPLQPDAMLQGGSLFVDTAWSLLPDPWQALGQIEKIKARELRDFLEKGRREKLRQLLESDPEQEGLGSVDNDSFAPAFDYANLLFEETAVDLSQFDQADVTGCVQIVREKGLRIVCSNLAPKLQGQLFLLASYWNPEYQGRNIRFASGPPVIGLGRFSRDGQWLELPRALQDRILEKMETAKIPVELVDRSQPGESLELEFTGELRAEQKVMVDTLLEHDFGILEAATGTGKTVMAAALIARKQVNTLILVQSKEILAGWVKTLNAFLHFKNEEFEQARLKSRTYPGKIGVLQSQTNTLCGRIDVAMIPSLISNKERDEILARYGMVLVDECHHAASPSAQKLLNLASAHNIYGFSATPKRTDGLDPSITWQIGPVQTRFTSRQQMASQEFTRHLIPRMTAFTSSQEDISDFMRVAQEAASDPLRNQMILQDVCQALESGRTVLVLSRFVEHARLLAALLSKARSQTQILVYAGDPKEKQENAARLKALPAHCERVLIGTYSSIGEGFDYPPLDTLMLTIPVRSQISISQAIGRIHRAVENKRDVLVYDYVDESLAPLAAMYQARCKEYRKQGYRFEDPARPVWSEPEKNSPKEADTKKQNEGFEQGFRMLAGTGFETLQTYESDQMPAQIQADLNRVQKRIAILARTLDLQAQNQLLTLLFGLHSRPTGWRIDLFVEEMPPEQIFELEKHNIHVHVHERIIETGLILDQNTIWYGPVWQAILQKPGGQDLSAHALRFIRMESTIAANFILEARRKEEIRILKARARVSGQNQ